MSRDIHIDDLARPRLPWPLRAANVVFRGTAQKRIRFEREHLLAEARAKNRLEDFGDPSFHEPLDVLLESLEREAELTALGRATAVRGVLEALRNRLRLEALIAAHPEILDEKIGAPIVIVGMPRTGTTHLFNLLALHPALRSLPFWESIEPVPANGQRAAPGVEDQRLVRLRKVSRLYDWVLPHMRAIHEIGPNLPHEDIQLQAMSFRSLLFDVTYRVPSYSAWYAGHDQTPSYQYLRRTLQALQWLRGPRRWLLKTPAHLEFLPTLLKVFPDARVIQMHRDPVEVIASFCMMVAYGARVPWHTIDLAEIGRHWARRIETMLAASVRDRPSLPAGTMTDVRFDDFVRDNLGAVERVLGFAGLDFTAEARARMERLNAERPRYAHGRVVYRLEDFGLDADERRAAFRFYESWL